MRATEVKKDGIFEEKQAIDKEISHLMTLLEAERSRESDIRKKLEAASKSWRPSKSERLASRESWSLLSVGVHLCSRHKKGRVFQQKRF